MHLPTHQNNNSGKLMLYFDSHGSVKRYQVDKIEILMF